MASIEILGTEYTLYLVEGFDQPMVLDPCWKCGGDRILPHYLHVYGGDCFACRATGGTYLTPEQMARRIKGREARARARIRKASAKETKRQAALAAFVAAHEDLAFLAGDAVHDDEIQMHPILRDMGLRLQGCGSLSDKQVDFARRLVLESQVKQDRYAVEKAAAQPAPAGRQVIEGKIIKVTSRYNEYSYHDELVYRMTVKTDAGWLCNGTAPAGIEGVQDLEGDFEDRLRGQRIRFTATLEPKSDDPIFAFFKRPTRCALVTEGPDPTDLQDAAAGNFTPGSEY